MLTQGSVVYYARIVGESIDLGCVTFAPQPLLSGLHSFWGTQFLHKSVNYPARAGPVHTGSSRSAAGSARHG